MQHPLRDSIHADGQHDDRAADTPKGEFDRGQSHAEVPATGEVAIALGLRPGDPVIELRTVSSGDGRPLSVSSSYYPAQRFPRMAEEFERLHSVTKAFAAHGLDDYVRASTEIVARHADAEELSMLKLSPGAIVLEPFGGSGSQIIAAEKLGRRARVMELQPAPVMVTVNHPDATISQVTKGGYLIGGSQED